MAEFTDTQAIAAALPLSERDGIVYVHVMRSLLFILSVLLLIPVCARAGADLPPQAAAARDYLNSLESLRARFVQTNPDGRQLTGTFYLSRPGRLRFSYDPPVEDFIVADGLLIYFYDGDTGQMSNAPIGQTLADFLLRERLSLGGEIEVESILQAGGLLQIELVQTADPGAGSLVLGFEPDPLALRKWRVLDPQGNITEIELGRLETDAELDNRLFVYRAPNPRGGSQYNP